MVTFKGKGGSKLENYIKVLLYVYPRLEEAAKDYGEHIRNKAILSCDGKVRTEKLIEYLTEEIARKEKIEELKEAMDEVLEKLSDKERLLLELRYFRRKRKLEEGTKKIDLSKWGSERNYFRLQKKLADKLGALMKARGLTEEKYFSDYAGFKWIASVYRYVEAHKKGSSAGERALIGLLSDGKAETKKRLPKASAEKNFRDAAANENVPRAGKGA